MSVPGELIQPKVFLDIAPTRFNQGNYVGRTEQSGIWTAQAELRSGSYTNELELALYGKSDIASASLYAWYTTMARRRFVYIDIEGQLVGTHIFSQEIQDAAGDPEVEAIASHLFGTPKMREEASADASDQCLVKLPALPSCNDETKEMRLAKEEYRQLTLPWVVAGATAMLNEIVHDIQPDNAWAPPEWPN